MSNKNASSYNSSIVSFLAKNKFYLKYELFFSSDMRNFTKKKTKTKTKQNKKKPKEQNKTKQKQKQNKNKRKERKKQHNNNINNNWLALFLISSLVNERSMHI